MAFVRGTAGGRIEYERFDTPGGRRLLLIEGLGAQMVGWRQEWCELLRDRGFTVIRFDNRDSGLSERYPLGGYTLRDMAQDARDLLTALEAAPAHVVGQSMGGMIAQQLALDHPDAVASLTMFYSAPSVSFIKPGGREASALESLPIPTSRAEAGSLYLEDERICASPGYPFDEVWKRRLGEVMWERGWDPRDTVRQLEAIHRSPDRAARLGEIRVPTTLIHGTDDRLISETGSQALAHGISGSSLHLIPGLGHELPVALWEQFADLISATADRGERQAGRVG